MSSAIFRFHSFTSPSALTLKIGVFAPSIILQHREELGADVVGGRARLVDVPTQDLGGAGKGLAPLSPIPNVSIYNKAGNSPRRGRASSGSNFHCIPHGFGLWCIAMLLCCHAVSLTARQIASAELACRAAWQIAHLVRSETKPSSSSTGMCALWKPALCTQRTGTTVMAYPLYQAEIGNRNWPCACAQTGRAPALTGAAGHSAPRRATPLAVGRPRSGTR